MKKTAVALVALASIAFGAPQTDAPDPHALPSTSVNPSAGPRVSNGYNLFLTADFIYWYAVQGNMDYALSGVGGNAPGDPSLLANPPKGKSFGVDHKMKPGFKAGLGWTGCKDGWDLYANYTWFQANDLKGSTTADNPSSTVSVWLAPSRISGWFLISEGSAKWDFHFNAVDLELGRNFFVSRRLALRPHVGLKGSWQEQHYDIDYVFTTISSGPNPNNVTFIKQTVDFWGVGIRTGLNGSWYFNRNWSFYGDLGLSGLWSRFKTKRVDTAVDTTTGSTFKPYNIENIHHQITPVLELGFGLQEEVWWHRGRYHVAIRAGWEEQVWFNMNQFDDLQDTPHGNLDLQGLTVRARFDF